MNIYENKGRFWKEYKEGKVVKARCNLCRNLSDTCIPFPNLKEIIDQKGKKYPLTLYFCEKCVSPFMDTIELYEGVKA